MKMRDGDNAEVDLTRLQLYCLDPRHARGGHKARQFVKRLGLTARDADTLRENLLNAARTSDKCELGHRDEFGQRFLLDVEVTGPNGVATIRTSWIAREGDPRPRFTTCFVV